MRDIALHLVPMRAPVLPMLSLATALLLAPSAAPAQQAGHGGFSLALDRSALLADGRQVIRRAPAAAVDEVLQALIASARQPREAEAVCALFDPGGDRSLSGLNDVASQLPPQSRERLTGAVAGLVFAALQAPAQPWDEDVARQALKQAGVRAALVQDGFTAGLQGDDHAARCRSVATLLEVLADRPLEERVGVARLLMDEGLSQLDLLASSRRAAPGGGPGA